MLEDSIAEMSRRSLMQNLALFLGATAVPTLASCKAARKGKAFLDAGQFKILVAVADTIIPVTDTPGAVQVGVPKLVDGMLRDWASAETKAQVIGAITSIGKLAGDKNFAQLDAAKRKALLLDYDKAALKLGPLPKKKLSGFAAMIAGAPVMNPDYVRLKGMIINLYYNSEMASAKELVFEPVPGKFVPSFKVTPETRPFAGVGGIF
jgi:hypothetical protein